MQQRAIQQVMMLILGKGYPHLSSEVNDKLTQKQTFQPGQRL